MIYRQLEPKDVDQVAQLVYDAFMKGYYDVPEDKLFNGAYNYAIMEIRGSTFVEVCEDNGKILGFMMGYVIGMEKKFSEEDYPFIPSICGDFKWMCRAINECNARMKSKCGLELDCEATEVIVDPSARGKGLGTRLFDDIIKHFKEHGCKSMYLFTGDNCNMSYYEHRKEFKLVGQEMVDLRSRFRDSRMYAREI